MSFFSDLFSAEGRYRYLVSSSYLAGGPNGATRVDASSGQVLLHESAANGRGEDLTDYIEADTIGEISNDTPHKTILTAPEDDPHYNYYSVYRTENLLAADADLSTVKETFLYCKDIPAAKSGYVYIASGLNPIKDIFNVVISESTGFDVDGSYSRYDFGGQGGSARYVKGSLWIVKNDLGSRWCIVQSVEAPLPPAFDDAEYYSLDNNLESSWSGGSSTNPGDTCVGTIGISTTYYNEASLSVRRGDIFSDDDVGNSFYVNGVELIISDIVSHSINFGIITVYKADRSRITDADLASYQSNLGYFGSDRCFKFTRATLADGTPIYTVEQYDGTALSSSDEGKVILMGTGKPVIVLDVYEEGGKTKARCFEPVGPPVLAYTEVAIDYYVGTIGLTSRVYNDRVKDVVLRSRKESGESLYFLQTRFFESLPNGNLGEVTGGAYWVSAKSTSEYQHTQVSNLYRSGSYRPDVQKNTKPVGAITRLKALGNGRLCIFEKMATYYVDTTVIENVGDSRVGEYVPVYKDPVLVTDRIGCPTEGNAARVDNANEIIFTGEPAIRPFNGFEYGPNLADGKIQNSDVVKLYQSVVSLWNSRLGLKIQGVKNLG